MIPSLKLFRKQAIASKTSANELNEMVHIVTPKSWIGLAGIYLLLLGLVLWGCFGDIHTYVRGIGLLLAENGTIYSAEAIASGRIIQIVTKPGQKVKQGQILAYLENPDLMKEIEAAEAYKKELEKNYHDLLTLSKQQIAERDTQAKDQQANIKTVIENAKANLVPVQQLMEIRENAYKKGIITRPDLVNSQIDYYRIKHEINTANEQLIQNIITQNDYTLSWNDRLRAAKLKLDEANYSLHQLKNKIENAKVIKSTVNGIVIALQAGPGKIVKEGMPVVTIASEGSGLDSITYVPASEGKRIAVGMLALVSPSTVKKAEYGSILGKVVEVSHYPVNQTAMMAILQNEDLVRSFSKDQSLITVRIRLMPDSKTYSGFHWTSSKGPQEKITAGGLSVSEIRVHSQPPITLLIPTIKKFFGIVQ